MHSIKWICALGALLFAVTAAAQRRADDPGDPAAAAPPLVYASAFADYKPLGDAGAGNWKEVNDRVREAAAKAPAAHGHHGGKP